MAAGFVYINAYTDPNWSIPENISFQATDAILRLNNISIHEASLAVSAGCNDFVKRCFWGSDEFPCRQQHEYLSFSATTSYLGPCCSFNYNPRNSSYIPFSSNIFGIDGGLTFVGEEGAESRLQTGLIVLVHHPLDFVTEAAAQVTITANSESFVEISPTVHSSSAEVLELSRSKRDCLTSGDLQLGNYRQAACMLSCQERVISDKCNCYPYYLPNVQHNTKECKLNATECFRENYGKWKNVSLYKTF